MDHEIWQVADVRCPLCGAYYRHEDLCADCGRCIDCVARVGHEELHEH